MIDYKILRITDTTTTCTVEVYSLTANFWTLITDDAPVTTSCLNSNSIAYLNGTFYWPRDGNWIWISLDIENETFKERSTTWISSDIYMIPSEHDDSLAILASDGSRSVLLRGHYVFKILYFYLSFSRKKSKNLNFCLVVVWVKCNLPRGGRWATVYVWWEFKLAEKFNFLYFR